MLLNELERSLTESELLEVALMISAIALAFFAVEIKNILHAVIVFAGFCITIGALFWILNAPYVAIFQLLLYAGAVVAIFLAAIMLTSRKESVK